MFRISSLLLIAALAFSTRLVWLYMIPSAEAPDEATHLWVIKFLSTNIRLPSPHEIARAGALGVYGSIPQLGYLPHLCALRLLPGFTELIASRVASLSLSVTSVLLAAGVGKQLFPNKPLLRWQLPLTLIFHPQFVFVGAYANNDSTAIAVASAILLLSMESVEKGLKFWRTLLIGFLTGWLILTKYNAYAIIPAAFCSLLLSGYRRKLPLKAIALHLSLLIGTALSLSSWWFIRNCQLFQGDLTGSRTLLRTWTETYHKSVDARGSLWTVISQSRWWRMNFFSFWGWFGYMTRSLPRPFYYGYLAFLALAFAGGLRFFRTGLPNTFVTMRSFALKQNEANCWRTASLERVLWLPVWLTVLANFALAIYGTASGVSGPQGRYFFVSEIPLIALLLAGLDQLPGASGRFAVLAFAAFNIVSYLYATWFLFSLYGFGGVCR